MTPSRPIHEIVKDSVQSIVKEFPTGNEYESGYKDGYQMGYSVAGNDYGLKWEQAKKALAIIRKECPEGSWFSKTIDKALSSWKEEGKQ